MSQTIQLVQCINYYCKNPLTEFELKRIRNERHISPRNHMCKKCKIGFSKIDKINCVGCYTIIDFTGRNSKCESCKSLAGRKASLKWSHENVSPPKEKIKDMILQVLRANEFVNLDMFYAFTKTNRNTIRKMIWILRNEGFNIQYDKKFYFLEESK